MNRCALCLAAFLSITSAFAQQPNEQSESTFGTTVVIPAGLRGDLYFIPDSTTVLPDFEKDHIKRAGEIWTDTLNVSPRHWSTGFPGLSSRFEWFAIDYSGKFWIEKPGRYAFALLSDDGSRLFLDNTPIIDNDCLHPADLRLAAVKLEGGVHQIRVEYFQGPRDCIALILAIAPPDQPWRIFDTREFKPPSNPEAWNYPSAGSTTLVPTTPQEASLSIDSLFKQLADDEANGNAFRKSHSGKSCGYVSTVRTCSR